jgi:hypothetical protein
MAILYLSFITMSKQDSKYSSQSYIRAQERLHRRLDAFHAEFDVEVFLVLINRGKREEFSRPLKPRPRIRLKVTSEPAATEAQEALPRPRIQLVVKSKSAATEAQEALPRPRIQLKVTSEPPAVAEPMAGSECVME